MTLIDTIKKDAKAAKWAGIFPLIAGFIARVHHRRYLNSIQWLQNVLGRTSQFEAATITPHYSAGECRRISK